MTTSREFLSDFSSDLDHGIASVESDLRRQAHALIRDMERLLADLDAGYNISECGVVQSRGLSLDLLAQKRQNLYAQKRQIEYALENATDEETSR